MDTAVVTGLFALGGVVIGGLLNGIVSYALDRRRENRAVRKAARLFAPHLTRLMLAADRALEHRWEWGTLTTVTETNLERWDDEYAPLFADSLPWDWWFSVYTGTRAYQQMTWTAPEDPATRITEADRTYLEDLVEKAAEAAVILAMVGMSGPAKRRLRRGLRGLWWRIRGVADDEEAEAMLKEARARTWADGSSRPGT